MSVLVLDADTNAGIAIIRSLGRRGIEVIAADSDPEALGLKSRYAKKTFCYPDPLEDVNLFIQFVEHKLKELGAEFVIPTTDRTLIPLSRNREKLPQGVILAAPEGDIFEAALNKANVYTLAKNCNIPVPKSYLISKGNTDTIGLKTLEYPVVVKPAQSKVWIDGKGHSLGVSYANTYEELLSHIDKYSSLCNVIVQEFVEGQGCGIEILAREGETLSAFQHNRIREFPISGGASSIRESAFLNPVLLDYAKDS